ncbi:alpha/beta fold hydrolase [Nocardia tengchongensis]|uniref:alpha/beta fold hydrolase n=1 Tax=Nocardia tengchongensis TaxID=2055889 RepID=UPI003688622B
MSARAIRDRDFLATGSGRIRLACTHTGTGQAPVKAVYLHGLIASSRFWTPLIGAAAARLGDQVDHVAIDARGHGRSAWPQPRDTSDIAVLADDLAALLDTIATAPVVMIAHSIGGHVLLEYARRHRDQFHRHIAAVLLFNAAGERPWWPQLRPFRVAASAIRPLRRTPADAVNAWAHAVMQKRMIAMAGRAKPGRAQLVPDLGPVDPRVTADICTAAEAFRLDDAMLDTLGRVRVHVVGAQFDAVVPPDQTRQLAAAIPGARLDIVDRVGHSLPHAHPFIAADLVAEAVESLRLTPGPTEYSAGASC